MIKYAQHVEHKPVRRDHHDSGDWRFMRQVQFLGTLERVRQIGEARKRDYLKKEFQNRC